METKYNSEAETRKHIARVVELLLEVAKNLLTRANVHDRSKLEEPEKSTFDKITQDLKGMTYGSDLYKEKLKEFAPALSHHYEKNSHHPEHFPKGISGMSLLDIIEMLGDWKAATERHADGSLEKSLEINKGRFEIGDQLLSILKNTKREMGW